MSTYVPIQAITLTSNTTSIQFTGIPQTFTDLVIVCSIRDTASGTQTYPWIRFNGDSATNYSFTRMHGNGTSAVSGRASNQDRLEFCEAPGTGSAANYFAPLTVQVMNYANTTTNKTTLVRTNNVGGAVQAGSLVCLYRSTSAITSILINGQTQIASGSTFTLYGIGSGSPKAFGGDEVRTDGTFWYHIFRSSGRFEPVENLNNVDFLVIAGGGGGGNADGPVGGGGGAGGYRCSVTGETSGGGSSAESKLNLIANTNYTVTVGAGGAGLARFSYADGNNGSNSVFASITSIGGGGGAGSQYGSNNSRQGRTGGSGGGSSYFDSAPAVAGGLGTSGQGSNGGSTASGFTGNRAGAGGGGAGSAGGNVVIQGRGTVGGNGLASSITGTSVTRAGGGGGAGDNPAQGYAGGTGGGGSGSWDVQAGNGTVNTGSGGGGTVVGGSGAGGSGIVIVRYAV